MLTLDAIWRAKIALKLSSKYYRMTEYAKSNNVWITYTDDVNQNILAVLRTFWNLQKIFYKKLCTKETTSKAATVEFLSKISNRKKISNEDFTLCEAGTSLDEIIKSIFSTNNDGLKAVFYKHFLNELAPVLLDVYDSWAKFGTMGVTSRTGIISAIYNKGDKRDIENCRPI